MSQTNPAPEPEPALTPLLSRAGFAPLPHLAWIRVTGPDRVRWLNGMVTNSIIALTPGQGCYCFVLNAQGRIQADLTAFAPALSDQPESLLLQTDASRLPALIALLDRFIIMDEVELAPVTPELHGLLVAGPEAESTLAALGLAVDPHDPLHLQSLTFHTHPVLLLHAHSPLIPRFELWAAPEALEILRAALLHAGLPEASPETLEYLRILEGTPLFGTDIRDRDLPQETSPNGGTSRALHFSKGCYLGQEIVERIHSRGAVHRTFSGFVLAGPLPPPGTPLLVDEKPAGELTSLASIPLSSGLIQLALGYIRREHLERASPLSYPGGTAFPVKLPSDLPSP